MTTTHNLQYIRRSYIYEKIQKFYKISHLHWKLSWNSPMIKLQWCGDGKSNVPGSVQDGTHCTKYLLLYWPETDSFPDTWLLPSATRLQSIGGKLCLFKNTRVTQPVIRNYSLVPKCTGLLFNVTLWIHWLANQAQAVPRLLSECVRTHTHTHTNVHGSETTWYVFCY